MKVLVTGGAGFIASHLVDRLIADGHEVVIIDDLSTGFQENINPKATFYRMDIRDDAVSEVFEKERPDIVDHHAAQMAVIRSLKEPEFDADVNIIGSLKIIMNCIKHDVKKLVYISTGGAVYGEPQYLPVDEAHPINPLSQYGITKHTVEHYLFLYHITDGLNYTALRYPNVYGPRQYPYGEAGVTAIFSAKMLKGETPIIFGDGEQLRDYVYIDDIVEANILAMTNPASDNHILNIGSGRGSSVNEIFRIIKDATGFSGEPVYAPARKGEVYKIYISAEKAKKVMGWEPKVSFEDGLKRLVEHQRGKM
ncbi:MAG: NAD-dependent epimerase/dehydratase family protein [Candidatus Coatesbacteria bacterium]|nr:NAD-dependent epimerase/dehydratase family protein [Candidatus Coatesbacteria bacterium]